MKTYKIAVIPGDGIGTEVVSAGLQVLTTTARKHNIEFATEEFPWSSDFYLKNNHYIPEGGLAQLKTFDAIYFGAVGSRDVPDHVSLRELRIKICKGLNLEVCERPARILKGIDSPLKVSQPEKLNWFFVRQNVDGEYAGVGHRDAEGASDHAIYRRDSVTRIAEYAFEIAGQRSQKVSYVTKSNAMPNGMVMWDETIEQVAKRFPKIKCERVLTDAFAYRMLKDPLSIDVVLGSNLHADILTDLSAAVMGSLGIAPSSNIDPTRANPPMFEPVHGSAFDIVGKGIANPIGQIWSGALMLNYLGETEAARTIEKAIEATCAAKVFTPDLGGNASTSDVTRNVLAAL